jgi:hypothetical protein
MPTLVVGMRIANNPYMPTTSVGIAPSFCLS